LRRASVSKLHGLAASMVLSEWFATDTLGRPQVGRMHIVCYLRQGFKVFETYWTTIRGVEAMDNNYRLLD